MEYITVRNTDLKISRLCMGGCPMGGYGWGKVDDESLLNTIHVAIESGVTIFDTADTYGLGKSEEILGKGIGSHRKDVIIATKFGVRVSEGKTIYDNSSKYIKDACDASLKRLCTDYIDIYQIHYRDGITPLSEVLDTLKELRKQGKIRYFGMSNIHKEDISEIGDSPGDFISFQDEYSLACRKNEKDILEIQEKLNMIPFTWGSLGQGILTGKYDRNVKMGTDDRRSRDVYVNFHGEKLLKNLEIVEEMKHIQKELEDEYGKKISLSAIAIRFILDHISGSVVIAGAKRPSQLNGNLEAFGCELNQNQINRLCEVSLDSYL